MMPVGQTDPVLVVQFLLINTAAQPRHVADREIGLAGFERAFRIAVDPCGFQPDAGRLRADMGQQPREQRDVTRVGHADAKPSLGRRGIERDLPRGEAPQGFENFPAGPDQRVGLRGRRHAAGRANEQRIVQMFPQVPEPDADRRLALAQLLGDARDAAHVVQEIEKLKQLQVGQVCGHRGVIVHGNDDIVSIALSA